MRKDAAQIARAQLGRLPEGFGNEHFWLLATLWEAALGLDDKVSLAGHEAQMQPTNTADWIRQPCH